MSAATARSGGSVCFGFGMEFIVTPRTKLHGVFSSSSALWKSESALDLVQPLGTGPELWLPVSGCTGRKCAGACREDRRGRRIFDQLKKSASFFWALNVSTSSSSEKSAPARREVPLCG